jgi:hypothetical protein
MIMSGILSTNMPVFLSAVNYLSPIRYAIRNLAPYSLHPILFTCEDWQRIPDATGMGKGRCTIQTGYDVLDLYNLNVDPKWEILALGACALVYRFLAFGLLKLARAPWEGWWGRRKGKAAKS